MGACLFLAYFSIKLLGVRLGGEIYREPHGEVNEDEYEAEY